jgi:hypothetical protein
VLDPGLVEGILPTGSFYRFLAENVGRIASEDVVGGLFSDANGRRSAIAPEYYVALILLRYHDKVSYQVASERAQFDGRWRMVLGKSPTPSRSSIVSAASLQEFEDLLRRRGRHDALLVRTIKMAREDGVLPREVTTAQDSTPIIGRGAVKDTYNLVGDGLRRLLRALAKVQGEKPLAVAERYGVGELFRRSTKATAGIDWSSPDARRGFLQQLVETAEAVVARAIQDASAGVIDAALAEAIAILRKVIEQDVDRRKDGTVSIRIGVAPDRLISIHDPEMRRGHKSQSEPFEGYKLHHTTEITSSIVMAITVTGANVHDSVPSEPMADQAEQSSGCIIEKAIGDAAYGTEANRVAHDDAGRMLVAKLPRARPTARFSKQHFKIDLQHQTVTCPSGNTTAQFTRIRRRREHDEDPSDVGFMQRFSFDARVCGGCPKRVECVPNGETRRRVDVGPNERLVQNAREYANDPQFHADRVARQMAERIVARFAQLGARQARVRGQAKVAAQMTIIAALVNLTRLHRLALDRDRLLQPRAA